jgi:hypothetical protein
MIGPPATRTVGGPKIVGGKWKCLVNPSVGTSEFGVASINGGMPAADDSGALESGVALATYLLLLGLFRIRPSDLIRRTD